MALLKATKHLKFYKSSGITLKNTLKLPVQVRTRVGMSLQMEALHSNNSYLGTESSPRSVFSGLHLKVMTVCRPLSQEDVACGDLRKEERSHDIEQK